MKHYENLPKVLPVPDFLDEKILHHAADLAAHRRQLHTRRRLFFGAAAAAAALVVAAFVWLPERGGSAAPTVPEIAEWSTLDQESYVLCAELNSYNAWDEEFSI